MLHHIQKNILDILAMHQACKYGELNPHKLDGNVFTYHLKQLIIAKLVVKNEDGSYQLTQLGKEMIVHRYDGDTVQPHSIFLIVIKCGDQWLLRERLVQPLLGRVGFIHGEPSAVDDSVVRTAEKRLFDKTGIDAKLVVKSSGLVRIYEGNELQSFSHTIILYGEIIDLIVLPSDQTGKNSWGSIDDTSINWLPSCHDIIHALDTDTQWFDTSYTI